MLYFLDLHPAFVLRNSASRQHFCVGERRNAVFSIVEPDFAPHQGIGARQNLPPQLRSQRRHRRKNCCTRDAWRLLDEIQAGLGDLHHLADRAMLLARTVVMRRPQRHHRRRRQHARQQAPGQQQADQATMAGDWTERDHGKKITAEPWTPRDGRRFHAVAHAYLYII